MEITNIKDLPIQNENLISFANVTLTMPFTSLFSRKKSVNIAIEKPVLLLNENLLKIDPGSGTFASGFIVKHIDLLHGEIRFKNGETSLQLLDFNLHSGPLADGLAFKLDSPHLKIIFPLNDEPLTLEGNLDGEIRQQGGIWKISRLQWQTRDIHFNINGRILADGSFYLNTSAQGDPENILRPLLDDLTVKGLTYANAQIVKNARNRIQIKADFTSPTCVMKESLCSKLAGNMTWNDQSSDLALEATFDTPLSRGWVQVTSKHGETDVAIHDIPAAYLANVLDIGTDAPLSGIVRRSAITITQDFITGKVDLDASPARPLTLPFVVRGTIDFQRDKQKKQITFSGRELQLNLGQLDISGQIDSQQHTLDMKINAVLKNMENVAAYSAFYLDFNLLPWKLSQGQGNFFLEITNRPGNKQSRSHFIARDFLANQQAIEALQGDVQVNQGHALGDFTISAPDLKALAKLEIVDHNSTIHFQNVRGDGGKILKILNQHLALHGEITGAFTYQKRHNPERSLVQGAFQAPRLEFLGLPLDQVSSDLSSDLNGVALSRLSFGCKRGTVRDAAAAIDYEQKKFAINGRIEGIDVSQISNKLNGLADIEVNGRGEFLHDPLAITWRSARLSTSPGHEFSASGNASVRTDFSNFIASGSGALLNPAGTSPLTFDLSRQDSHLTGQFNLNLIDLNLLIPWKNNSGSMRLLGQIYSNDRGRLRSRGVAVFSGQTLSLPNFSHSLDNFQATLTFDGMKFNLQSLSGEMGGGRVDGNGHLEIDHGQLQGLTFNLQGKSMRLYPLDRISCELNADLTLRYLAKKLFLSGTLGFLSANWQREIDEPLAFGTRAELSTTGSRLREMLQLDITMNGDNIQINNSIGRINGKLKLKLTGTAAFPVLIGTYEGNQGEIHFSDRSFNLLKAKLVFNNSLRIDPLVTIESETFIQNYRIRFDIKGAASSAKPELVSSPPLPPQDILALVSLGEAFQRSGSQEISSQLGSTALLTTELAKEIKNRANRLLGINLLRIDPMLKSQSAYDTSRLTIGTSITKNLVIVYSTNLSTTRQEIYYLQYQLSPAVSLIYMKNEEGRYSIDLRVRKRR
ncbi:MAG: translocation/assembly module TamB domain-containing protein [Candidatus Aminicenantes bacterium]|nr:translocation/assembly module TamB domain-containing protein [Candidatus Aminicenantes bacterium]